jgi:hypothetical protein
MVESLTVSVPPWKGWRQSVQPPALKMPPPSFPAVLSTMEELAMVRIPAF